MNAGLLLAGLRRTSTLTLFAQSVLTGLGLIAGIIGLASGLFPDVAKALGWPILIGALGAALIYGAWQAWPRTSFSREFEVPRTKISVVVGDLFEQDGHLVIGMTDTFDTEPPMIAPISVQAQFLEREYGGDVARLDADLAAALSASTIAIRETRHAKPLGKLARYPIGTVAVLGNSRRKYYGLVYSRMTNNSVAESSVSHLWNSLMALWPVVRSTGDLGTVSIAAIGMGLARLSGQISQADVIRLIIISFLTSSRERVVASHLRIVLAPRSAEKVDLQRLADYLAAQ